MSVSQCFCMMLHQQNPNPGTAAYSQRTGIIIVFSHSCNETILTVLWEHTALASINSFIFASRKRFTDVDREMPCLPEIVAVSPVSHSLALSLSLSLLVSLLPSRSLSLGLSRIFSQHVLLSYSKGFTCSFYNLHTVNRCMSIDIHHHYIMKY